MTPELPSRPGGWPVIYADPPWRFKTWSEKGMGRSPDGPISHYQTMSLLEICALSVADITAKSAVLYLWATNPLLPQALEVMRAWGFCYKTNLCWDKQRIGTGYWLRGRHELLLIGAIPKASGMAPQRGCAVPSVLSETSERRHSRKPSGAYEMIERYHPGVPKLELFARPPLRADWTAWGNEVAA